VFSGYFVSVLGIMTKKNMKPIVTTTLSAVVMGLAEVFIWAFHSVGYLAFPWENSSNPSITTLPSATATPVSSETTVYYLAVNSDIPAPDDPVPVADQSTMQALIATGQAQDREKYNSIATSSAVTLVPGGAIVEIMSTSDDLVQVKLHGRDVKGNDLSGQTRWVSSKFIQNRKL
jgi:hypothetical protein